ncbi:RagB/SusD family nutrient uptake outer membrane protein [Capnocytophaga cynodegmi]|uniref:RagB/SusD family nutrient uptake outer membrane protein n=1 Tax=Capnocytophaga cynodegmi TaxID=28189 RepID=A0A250EA14_9FLAO|nr:RagB/SusD family nutrient uptake outer membrane protein [Capnocytophaga cynodegmi]ATA68577.1 RagB/SusD family nutrient uptake outer membrane protein [Capnocytophaga cynodegmi]
MKKIVFIIALVFTFSSCELDLKPESSLRHSGYWTTEEAVNAAHIGIYPHLRGYDNTFWGMGELRSDIWGGTTIESPFSAELIKNDVSVTRVHYGNWAEFYSLIHKINDFIKNAPTVPASNQEQRNHMMGQMYGIRAYVYYTMLKAWGEVPIATEPLTKVASLESLKKKRSPKEDVLALVKSDIEKSLEFFNTDNSKWLNKNIYWSKAATLTLKGDVYLWSGKVLGGGSADFEVAKTALESVTGYSLVNYEDLWGQAKEGNNEFIFALDYQEDQANNFYSSMTARQVDIKGKFDDEGNLLDNFTLNGGSRYGASAKVFDFLKADLQDQRSKTFMGIYSDKTAKKLIGTVLNKFLGVVETGLRRSWNNVPLYRYADVVLLLAEAKNHLGEDPSPEINKIRERAYGNTYNVATHGYTNANKSANAKVILDERLKEFVGEGKRWWDLVRAGDNHLFDEVPTMKASESYKIYYSISEGMIANDPELKQTEGYK